MPLMWPGAHTIQGGEIARYGRSGTGHAAGPLLV